MRTAHTATAHASLAPEDADSFWRPLLYRWFVEYNPLYLLSAALVLAGCFLSSRGLVQEESLAGPLGIACVAELYAVSLIGGTALLVRINLPRPAVMLALLSLLYQWDLTLHTETCAYLGAPGAWATVAWLALFVGKLGALAWALRVRVARRAMVAAVVAGLGLALAPRVLPGLGPRGAGVLLALWVFALGALYRRGGVTSLVALDGWGATVVRRATRAAWLISSALVGAHVLMWWKDHDVSLWAMSLAIPLLLVPHFRSEARGWATVLAVLVLAATEQPSVLWITALLAACALGLRALALRFESRAGSVAAESHASNDATPRVTAEQVRLLGGAVFSIYLSVWTARWSAGPWPAHVVLLDVALTLAIAILVWRTHARGALLPLAATYAHLVIQRGLMPHSVAGWGEASIVLGFALLGGSLFTSYRLRGGPLEPARDEATAHPVG